MPPRKRTTPDIIPPVARPPVRLAARSPLPGGFAQEQATHQMLHWLNTLPDPDLTLQKLGFRRADLRKLETDDEVYQCLEKRREAVHATPWRLEPGTGRFNRWLADELSRHQEPLIAGAFMAVPYGYSVLEAVYEPRPDGRIGLARIAEKPFEWFTPSPDGTLRYHPEDGRGGAEGLLCDPAKFFLTARNASYRNPYGEALFSRLYWPVFFRSNGWRFWAQFLERFGTPLLLGKTLGNPDDLADKLAQAVNDAVIVAGGNDDISAVESGKDGQQFRLFEDAILARIQKTILGQTLSSDAKATGLGSGVADLHQKVLEEKRRSDVRLIAGTVQRLINALCYFNGQPAPQFVLADESGLEMARAQRDALLVEKGIIELSEEYLLDRYDFKPGDFVVPEKAAAVAPPPEDVTPPEPTEAAAHLVTFAPEPQKFTAGQQVIEDEIARTLHTLQAPLSDQAIQAAIRAATSPEDLADRLAVVLAGADPLQLAGVLDKAFFAADLMGYLHSAPGTQDVAPAPAPAPAPTKAQPSELDQLAATLLKIELDRAGNV